MFMGSLPMNNREITSANFDIVIVSKPNDDRWICGSCERSDVFVGVAVMLSNGAVYSTWSGDPFVSKEDALLSAIKEAIQQRPDYDVSNDVPF